MSETTAIEWTDATWSPWEGCTKVGPGCDHCYAEAMNNWLRKGENWGRGAPRREYSDAHWQKPLAWNKKAHAAGKRMRVFPSVCDPFDNDVDPAWRARFFALISSTPHLDWLLLTKRIGNVAKMIKAPGMQKCGLPSNVWLGATVVNQEEADRDIPKLLATPARVRFLSIEPMLGPITLPGFNATTAWCPRCASIVPDTLSRPHEGSHDGASRLADFDPSVHCASVYDLLHWVIAGGESGRGARPAHPDWFRSLRDQCAQTGTPYLFKQWGEWLPVELPSDEECFAEDGSERQFEGRITRARLEGYVDVARIGKKAAGRLLDGVEHNGVPS